MTIKEFMADDHKACDSEFADLESLAEAQKWDEAMEKFVGFKDHMLKHFDMEEKVMFEEFNKASGEGCNPTGVMIMEHDQMRSLFDQMGLALEGKDKERFLGLSENLLFLMGQHNMKEEQMMYTMADNVLDSKATVQKMQEL